MLRRKPKNDRSSTLYKEVRPGSDWRTEVQTRQFCTDALTGPRAALSFLVSTVKRETEAGM